MIISCNTIVDRRDHMQYLTVSKSYSDNCTRCLEDYLVTISNDNLLLLYLPYSTMSTSIQGSPR